jgi:hypothetical protein
MTFTFYMNIIMFEITKESLQFWTKLSKFLYVSLSCKNSLCFRVCGIECQPDSCSARLVCDIEQQANESVAS